MSSDFSHDSKMGDCNMNGEQSDYARAAAEWRGKRGKATPGEWAADVWYGSEGGWAARGPHLSAHEDNDDPAADEEPDGPIHQHALCDAEFVAFAANNTETVAELLERAHEEVSLLQKQASNYACEVMVAAIAGMADAAVIAQKTYTGAESLAAVRYLGEMLKAAEAETREAYQRGRIDAARDREAKEWKTQ